MIQFLFLFNPFQNGYAAFADLLYEIKMNLHKIILCKQKVTQSWTWLLKPIEFRSEMMSLMNPYINLLNLQ